MAFFAKTSPTPPVDLRGKQPNLCAIPYHLKQQVHRHITSFPTIDSHYGRDTAAKGKKYLSSTLSVARMYDMYLEKFEPQEFAKGKNTNPTIKYDFYRNYFNTHFNLSFGMPKTDTCSKCDQLNVAISGSDGVEKQKLQDEKQAHLQLAQEFYAMLRTCSEMAQQNENIVCLSIDFEQNLPLPHIPTNEIFYLRQLWVYVFCVHDSADNNASMYVWPESIAQRGANEVVSCLHHYLSSLTGVDTLFLFSDSCPGQNKNSIVMHYLYSLVRLGMFQRI